MMRPRFVKEFIKDGKVVMTVEPEVIKDQIAKPQSVKTMQTILRHVVSQGLGKRAGSHSFQVAGKTGTAQVAKAGGYKSGTIEYWLSFCGYFPADDPKYTCIVCLKKSGLPASGGSMSGAVFHKISEGVMAKNLKLRVSDAYDSLFAFQPVVKTGDVASANYVLNHLKVSTDDMNLKAPEIQQHVMPNTIGMGAKDAVYQIERQGVKVTLNGVGSVRHQSIAPGTPLKPGMNCTLELK
jgi:cell division protein FtsI (penicillin-binding protein 3)